MAKRKHVLRTGQRQNDKWHSSSAEPAYIENGHKVVITPNKSNEKLMSPQEIYKAAISLIHAVT